MGYMFQLYGVIFRPSKTTDPILQGSQVHCGIPSAYIVVIITLGIPQCTWLPCRWLGRVETCSPCIYGCRYTNKLLC